MNHILMKWHRRIGIMSALFVLVLAVTGLLLLVSGPLNLTQIKIENALVSKIYGTASKTDPVGFKISEQQWVVMVDGRYTLQLNGTGRAKHLPVPNLIRHCSATTCAQYSNSYCCAAQLAHVSTV